MALTPPQRITMIREAATLLGMQEWGEIDLVLDQFGLPTTPMWEGTKDEYCRSFLQRASDDALDQVHAYLTTNGRPGPRPGGGPWSGEKLRVFFSHLAEHKRVVGEVARVLENYGVEPFVAHDSIDPSKEWQLVIEGALSDCDAMVVFLHPGFRESNWCDQEVGWALGRQRPILALNYGVHPHGFMSKFQDQPCSTAHVGQVAAYIMDWLIKTPSLHGRLTRGLVDAFVESRGWDLTRRLVPYLDALSSVDDDDLTRMERAAVDNRQVRECDIGGVSGPDWVKQYVAARRGAVAAPTWPSPS
ncbi:TIR domain-containing protein [Cellulosimicrobium cellulans]|nr:TIR domain-containing protein [Cellulosimicrobium cellulans]